MKAIYNENEAYNLVEEQELQDRREDFFLAKFLRAKSIIYSSKDLAVKYSKVINNKNQKITFGSTPYLLFLIFFLLFLQKLKQIS